MNGNFANISASTISRSLDRMNDGLRFAAGADFSKHTKWDNFKAAFNSLLAVFGLAESRSKVVSTKIDELDSASTHFAMDVLKSSNALGDKMYRITLKDSSGVQSEKAITFVENEIGGTEISTGSGRKVSTQMQFVDIQVLALNELLEIAEKSDPPKKINSNAISNFEVIKSKFREKYGENGIIALERCCEPDISNSHDVLMKPVPQLLTEADIAAALTKEQVINKNLAGEADNLIRDVNFIEGYNVTDRLAASKLLTQIRESQRPVSEKISAFAELSKLSNSRGALTIKIEEDQNSAAKVSFMVGNDVLFEGSCPEEDYAECLLDCPANLIGNEKPTGNVARIMFKLGKMDREKFNSIFSATNRAAAVRIMNDMCRNDSFVTNENFIALYSLVDKQATSIEGFLSIYLSDADIKFIANACKRLVMTLNNIPSRVGLEGGTNVIAKNDLTHLLNEVFGPGNQVPFIVQIVIKDILERSVDREVSDIRKNIKQEFLREYFHDQSD